MEAAVQQPSGPQHPLLFSRGNPGPHHSPVGPADLVPAAQEIAGEQNPEHHVAEGVQQAGGRVGHPPEQVIAVEHGHQPVEPVGPVEFLQHLQGFIRNQICNEGHLQQIPDPRGHPVQQRDGAGRQLRPHIPRDESQAPQQHDHRQGRADSPVHLFALQNLPVIQNIVALKEPDQNPQGIGDQHPDENRRRSADQPLPRKPEPVDQQEQGKAAHHHPENRLSLHLHA